MLVTLNFNDGRERYVEHDSNLNVIKVGERKGSYNHFASFTYDEWNAITTLFRVRTDGKGCF